MHEIEDAEQYDKLLLMLLFGRYDSYEDEEYKEWSLPSLASTKENPAFKVEQVPEKPMSEDLCVSSNHSNFPEILDGRLATSEPLLFSYQSQI